MYEIEKNGNGVVINFTLPWADMKDQFEAHIAKMTKNVEEKGSLKGFRKGKVPADIASSQVDRQAALGDIVDTVLRDEYAKAVKEEDLKFAGQPDVQVTKLAEGNDVEIRLAAELMPEIALPKKWEKIVKNINKENAKNTPEVTDEEVDAEVEKLAESRTENKVVERAAANGDEVKVDFTVKQDGVIIEGGTSTDHALVLGSGAFIPGFEEEVIGLSTGDEKSFELNFPEQYHAEHLAGKPATFDIVVKEISERITPSVDDAFAESLSGEMKTVADLKENLKQNILQEKQKNASESGRAMILEALAAEEKTELPASLISSELERMVGEMEQQIQMSGQGMDDYLKAVGKSREELLEEWKPQAEKRIKSALMLEELASTLEVEVSKEDVAEEMNAMMGMYQGMGDDMKDKVDMEQMYQYSMGIKRNEKVFEKLEELA